MEITVEVDEVQKCPVCGHPYSIQPECWRINGTIVMCKSCHDQIEAFGRMTNGLHEDNKP